MGADRRYRYARSMVRAASRSEAQIVSYIVSRLVEIFIPQLAEMRRPGRRADMANRGTCTAPVATMQPDSTRWDGVPPPDGNHRQVVYGYSVVRPRRNFSRSLARSSSALR
jgi:hypothetical protein